MPQTLLPTAVDHLARSGERRSSSRASRARRVTEAIGCAWPSPVSPAADDGERRRTYRQREPRSKETAVSQLTYSPATRSATTGLNLQHTGAFAGLVAGPLFLTAVAANTWASLGFPRGLGWQLVGGTDIPWPSSLATGPYGWIQIAAFLVAGTLTVLFGLGLRRALPARRSSTAAVILLTAAGAAIAASAFPVDAAMIHTGEASTWHGWIHGIAFLVALPSILLAPVATAVAVRRDPRWRRLSGLSLAATPAMIALLAAPLDDAGFYLFLAVAFGWIAAVAARLRRL
jgi:hypothetical protein